MAFEGDPKKPRQQQHSNRIQWQALNYSLIYTVVLFVVFVFLNVRSSSWYLAVAPTATSRLWSWTQSPPVPPLDIPAANSQDRSVVENAVTSPPLAPHKDPVITFLPLKDLRFAKTAMDGDWFMSSLNDTVEGDDVEHLHFPSRASDGKLLCVKGRHKKNGTMNSYALAWPGRLPDHAVILKGLSFVSDSYFVYQNLFHGFHALAPFAGWSMNNKCARPSRWILYYQGELKDSRSMAPWLRNLMEASYGDVHVESFDAGSADTPYCFEEAVVMKRSFGKMGKEKRMKVADLLRCRARELCGVKGGDDAAVVDEGGQPVIRLTLLMRRGSRSFKNTSVVIDLFAKECSRVDGCRLKVVQSDELSFCDQVRVMAGTDVLASPHGAQLTNMVFMDRGSRIMEFFPRGWLEYAGLGQYVYHWMAATVGMNHTGAWWEPLGKKDCPNPKNDADCFLFYKVGKVGHNETHFAAWARDVLSQVRTTKRAAAGAANLSNIPTHCAC